jgi:hypothetical protein
LVPDPRIRIPELKYGSESGRPINYGTGRIRVPPTYSKDADPDFKFRIANPYPGGQLIMDPPDLDPPDLDPHTDKKGSLCLRN